MWKLQYVLQALLMTAYCQASSHGIVATKTTCSLRICPGQMLIREPKYSVRKNLPMRANGTHIVYLARF